MKFIEKSRIETFLKAKGYSLEPIEIQNEETYWSKSEKEKVVVPKKEIVGSNELPKIFNDDGLLNEFRKY
ncbi:MAG: hypothetical protein Q8T03_07405 [Bacteroidota bacterium]|nr:hypothetical protein [Bacteroidota bacterium]